MIQRFLLIFALLPCALLAEWKERQLVGKAEAPAMTNLDWN